MSTFQFSFYIYILCGIVKLHGINCKFQELFPIVFLCFLIFASLLHCKFSWRISFANILWFGKTYKHQLANCNVLLINIKLVNFSRQVIFQKKFNCFLTIFKFFAIDYLVGVSTHKWLLMQKELERISSTVSCPNVYWN